MKRTLSWIAAAGIMLAGGNLQAVEVEVPGLLTDHTVTSVGHDFYRAFSDKWESDYPGNLTINERPSARWGSWITITANQDVIYQTFLFPTTSLTSIRTSLPHWHKQKKLLTAYS
jgi:hypothetical protein